MHAQDLQAAILASSPGDVWLVHGTFAAFTGPIVVNRPLFIHGSDAAVVGYGVEITNVGAGASLALQGFSLSGVTASDSHDPARALAHLLDHPGVAQAHAVMGASYGGMVALAFGALFPTCAAQLVVLVAAERPTQCRSPRAVQRRIVALGRQAGDVAAGVGPRAPWRWPLPQPRRAGALPPRRPRPAAAPASAMSCCACRSSIGIEDAGDLCADLRLAAGRCVAAVATSSAAGAGVDPVPTTATPGASGLT